MKCPEPVIKLSACVQITFPEFHPGNNRQSILPSKESPFVPGVKHTSQKDVLRPGKSVLVEYRQLKIWEDALDLKRISVKVKSGRTVLPQLMTMLVLTNLRQKRHVPSRNFVYKTGKNKMGNDLLKAMENKKKDQPPGK